MRSFLVRLFSLRSVLFLHSEAADQRRGNSLWLCSVGPQIAKPSSEQNHILPMSRSR